MTAQLKFTEIASHMVEHARNNGFISNTLAIVPELAETEKQLFIAISGRIKEFSSIRKDQSLNQDEMLSLFIFVYAKAAESVSCYLRKARFEYNLQGMFDGKIPLTVEENLIDYMKTVKLGESMYSAFIDWVADNPGFCADNGVHPVLPLLEALKWTFRIGGGLVIEFFEHEAEKQQQEKIN
ncbi:MAG: hypothetical protein JXR78_07765 [Victivallales bacterium]|nr:hypothetical protein [Victivallales bacterium]